MKKRIFFMLCLLSFCVLCTVCVGAADGTSEGAKDIPTILLVSALVGLVIAGIAIALMVRSMSTVRAQKRADVYADSESFHLDECRDIYLFSRVTRVRINNNNNRR